MARDDEPTTETLRLEQLQREQAELRRAREADRPDEERAAGRRADATRRVDPALIGGLVLQVGSLRVDASVHGRLERLRHELTTRT